MKRLAPFLLLLAWLPLRAQTTTPAPNCGPYRVTFSAAGVTTSIPNSSAQATCVSWAMAVVSNGFSAESVELQSAPDSSGSPGTWATFAGSVTSGSNPSTATDQAFTTFVGYYPWLRLKVNSVTGTGTIQFVLYGYKAQIAQPNPLVIGTTLPSTCAVGDMFFKTDAVAGSNLYGCTATNTWTAQAGGGGSLCTVSGSQTTGYVLTATDNSSGCSWQAAAGGGSLTQKLDGSTIATSSTQNIVTGTGLTITGSAPGGIGQFQFDIDSAVVPIIGTIATPIGFAFGDPAGSALTAGSTTTGYLTVPFACTIAGWNIMVDAGTVTFKVWRKATGTAIPTSADSINTSGISLSTGTAVHSTTVTDFTSTAIAANDILAFNISTVATAKYAALVLQCNR